MTNISEQIALELFHGRTSPDEDLNDWGSQGPVFFVSWVHVTYTTVIRVGLPGDDEGELAYVEDLIYYDGVYYGDWSVIPGAEVRRDAALAPRVCEFESTKALPPPRPVDNATSSPR